MTFWVGLRWVKITQVDTIRTTELSLDLIWTQVSAKVIALEVCATTVRNSYAVYQFIPPPLWIEAQYYQRVASISGGSERLYLRLALIPIGSLITRKV